MGKASVQLLHRLEPWTTLFFSNAFIASVKLEVWSASLFLGSSLILGFSLPSPSTRLENSSFTMSLTTEVISIPSDIDEHRPWHSYVWETWWAAS